MNGKAIKAMRKQARKAAAKRDEQILPELKTFINTLPFGQRARAAWRILWRKF